MSPFVDRPAVVPIGYDIQGAANAIGQSKSTVEGLIRSGELIPRYMNSKPIILHDELHEWAHRLPIDKPANRK